MYIERFREIFEANDELTIKSLCNDVGLDRSTIGKYINGYLVIPTKHLNSICNHFNKSIDYILYLSDTENYLNSNKNIDIPKFAIRIKELRKNLNLTQVAFSKKISINRSTISDYERGKKLINVNNLYKLCSTFNISADYLLGKIDEKNI